jgi:cation transport ATPase
MPDLRLHVHGMDCADEAALVRHALAPNQAIRTVEFDLINGNVDVTFDEASTDAAAILAAIRRTGLPAHVAVVESEDRAAGGGHLHDHDHADSRSTLSTAASGLFLVIGWLIEGATSDHWLDLFVHHEHDPRAAVFYALSALVGLWPMWGRAFASIRHRRLDMHVLVCITVLGAGVIGEWSEGAAVAFLFALAHRMEAWSIERARREISALVGRGPSLIAEGLQQSAPVELWIERFAAVYTPVVTGAAIMLALVPPIVIDGQWSGWFYRALVFLVLACPCALVISTPVTMIAALTSAAGNGVLVKGGAVLERTAAAVASREGLTRAGITVVGARDVRPVTVGMADVVLSTSDAEAIALLVAHARRALRVVRQNVTIALLTKVAFLISAPFGFAPLWMAVLADTGATVIVTLNGLRLLRMTR